MALPSASRAATGQTKPVPSVKVTVTHTAPTVHAAARGAAAAVARTGQPAKPPAPAAFNPLQNFAQGSYLSTPQIAQMANRITAQSTQASLVPLRQQAQQIQGTQQTVAGRLAGYNQQGDQIMQGLQANAQQGALTGENMAAQAASNTANAIDRSGAAAQALNGGYLDPQVAAALQNQRTQLGTNAGAEAQFANSQGQNNSDFMAQLRGAAASRAGEAQANVTSIYGKQLATNQGQQDALIAREAPTAKQLANSIGQQQFGDYIAGQNYKLNAQKVNISGLNARSLAQSRLAGAGTNAYNAQTRRISVLDTAAYRRGELALGNSRLSVTEQNDLANQNSKRISQELTQQGLSETKRSHLVNEQIAWRRLAATLSKGGITPAQSKAVANVYGGEAWYQHQLAEGSTPEKAAGSLSRSLHLDGAEGQAAVQMAKYGYIDTTVQAKLQAQGVTILPDWIKNRPAATAKPAAKPTTGKSGSAVPPNLGANIGPRA